MTLTQDILDHAQTLGFEIAGIAPVGAPRHAGDFADWLAAGYHAEMSYLAARAAERVDPLLFAPDARSMILMAATYGANNIGNSEKGKISQHDWPTSRVGGYAPISAHGRIARYACEPDYHDTIKPKLHALDAFIRVRTGRKTLGKGFVDTAPVLERDAAEQAGLGFVGRNCCLITPGLGSWTVLAGLMIPEALDEGRRTKDEAPQGTGDDAFLVDHSSPVSRHSSGISLRASDRGCGRCTRCLDACPTRAFVGPHVLDARRCISYLTIELRGPIPRDLRPLMDDWVFGCDICQEVCPYNRPVPSARQATQAVGGYSLVELLNLDDVGFRTRFRRTPVLRAKRRGLVRNACVAAGNAGDTALVPTLVSLLTDAEPLIRGHAAWALGQIGGEEALCALQLASALEADPWVCEEVGFSVSTLSSILA
jgi:epoxyqueuosine reductase